MLLIFLLFLATTFAQTAQQQAVQNVTIQGIVSRVGTSQALRGARVTLRRVEQGNPFGGELANAQGGNLAQVVTDASGRFLFGAVDPGQYRILVERDGYLRQEYGQRSYTGPGAVITFSPGQRANNLNFQMVPAGTISGRVFDETGQPLAGVSVQALNYVYREAKKQLTLANQAQTNDLGEYRLYWMMPGEYYISATARPATSNIGGRGGNDRGSQTENQETYAPTYYPGTLTPESAAPVALPPAVEVRGIDFILRPTATATLRGRVITPGSSNQTARGGVTGPARTQGPPISLMLSRAGFSDQRGLAGVGSRTILDSPGTFEIKGVVPGTYNLIASVLQDGQQYSTRMRLEVGSADINNLNVALRPGMDVPGRMYLDGTPSAQFSMTKLRVDLGPTADVLVNSAEAQVNEDGTFILKNVSPLEYRIRVTGLPQGAYVQAGLIGSADAIHGPLVIAGDQQVTLQLQLGFAAGRIQGIVNNAKNDPVPAAITVLVPEERQRLRPELYFSSPTDQSGRFTFNNVPPGTYKLFAWEEIQTGAQQDPDFIRKFEDRGKPVKLDPNGNVTAELTVIPAS